MRTVSRIAFDHLISRFEAGVGDFGHGELLVISLLGRNHRSVNGQREVDPRIRHQVRLELGEIHVQGSVESKRGRDGRNDLAD